MQKLSSRFLTVLLSLALVAAFIPVAALPQLAFAKEAVEDNPYQSFAIIGDSMSTGYGTFMQDNTKVTYFYTQPREGSYPTLLRDDLGLDGINSLTSLAQRITDIYYVLGGTVDDVTNHFKSVYPDQSTITYEQDTILYQKTVDSESFSIMQQMRDDGTGAGRIEDSDAVLLNIGLSDLLFYPYSVFGQTSTLAEKVQLISDAISQYRTYYPKLISKIEELNPDADIYIYSTFDPYSRFEITNTRDKFLLQALRTGLDTVNDFLQAQCLLDSKTTYIDITDYGNYLYKEDIVIGEDEPISSWYGVDVHAGAEGHQYLEDQALKAMGLERGTTTPSTDDTHSYLAFTSDANVSDDANSIYRLDSWLDSVANEQGTDGQTKISFDYLGICGNFANNTYGGITYTNKTQFLLDIVDQNTNVADGIYTTGCNEWSPGTIATESSYEPYASFTRLGEAADTDRYQVYCLGAAQSEEQFNSSDIAALSNYLTNEADSSKPVFVMSPFPLHSTSSGTVTNAQAVIDVLNQHPNVVYVWADNDDETDAHNGKVYTGKLDSTPITFTYCSAGCMSDSDYSSISGSIAGKGLVASIDDNGRVGLTYYDKDAQALSSCTVSVIDGAAQRISVQTRPTERQDCIFYDTSKPALTEPTAGIHRMVIGGVDCGLFVFTQADDGWTIYSVAEKKFVSITSGQLRQAFKYSSIALTWNWDSNSFYTSGTLGLSYHLTCDDEGNLEVGGAASSTTSFDPESYLSHSLTETYDEATHQQAQVCQRCEKVFAVGDANGDGSINAMDAQVDFDVANGVWTDEESGSSIGKLVTELGNIWNEELATYVADADGNEVINADDARAIQCFIHEGTWTD